MSIHGKKTLITKFLCTFILIASIGIQGCKNPTAYKYIPMELQFDIENVSEFGEDDGGIVISVSGGEKPYTYRWSNGKTTKNISDLIAGTYTVTVYDNKEKAILDSATVVQPDYINKPPQILSLNSNIEVISPDSIATINAIVTDIDNDSLLYSWSVDNTVLESGVNKEVLIWHAPNEPRRYTIKLNVNDGVNEQSKSISIRVNSIHSSARLVNPINNSMTKTNDILLTWECSDTDNDNLTYDVYIGETLSPPLVSSNQSFQYYDTGVLVDGREYFWKIEAKDNYGNVRSSNINSFTVSSSVVQEFTLGNSSENIKMVLINGGSFQLGAPSEVGAGSDEEPTKTITIDYDFWIGEFEVTQKQWKSIMGNWNFPQSTSDNHPATNISFNNVKAFIDSINNFENDSLWRLPSEAEWEYVCRAGHYDTRFWWGDDSNYFQLDNYAWYQYNASAIQIVGTVKTKKPNPWGVWDMQGNAYEYCEDFYHYDYNTIPTDGSPELIPDNGSRAMRGGSIGFEARRCRPSLRSWMQPTWKTADVGFRIVRIKK